MKTLGKVTARVDAYQQEHRWLAFPVAVLRTNRDALGGEMTAMLTYYGFLSVFPLLLAGVTVLSLLLRSQPELRDHLLGTALAQFPVVGTQLQENVQALPGGGSALLGVLVALFGARGVGIALQTACNQIWAVPQHERPEGVAKVARAFGLIAVVGVGVLATAAATGLVSALDLGPLGSIGVTLASLVVNAGLLLAALRVATAPVVPTRDLRLAAAVGAVGIVALHLAGSYLVVRQLDKQGDVYGSFAVVLGLIGWLYLQSRVLLLSVTASVVKARGLWPRALKDDGIVAADERSMAAYTRATERVPEQEIEVSFEEGGRTVRR